MFYTYDSITPLERIRRWIRAVKFYKTLPSKLNQAEREWHSSQPDTNKTNPLFTQHPSDGSEAQDLLGGPIQLTHDFVDDE
ncbi:MAG: hypothetical protein ACO20I_08860 [bacterium]|jgi:hypothetical protein